MLKKLVLAWVFAAPFFFLAVGAVAAPPLQTATLNTPGAARSLLLPSAADNAPIISLGTAVDPGTGKAVEGFAIIHQKESHAKPSGTRPGTTTCYGYLAKGAKWKMVEPWVVNSFNSRGLDPNAVFNLLSAAIAKWKDATDGIVGNGTGVDVLGPGFITADFLAADTSSPDNQNEVYFADIADSNAIAVTIVWGIFGGPVSGRQLVEWDQIYDDVTFDWSAGSTGVTGKMDFDNIATHELGHSVGLADLYNTCVDETMYGYSSNAETIKRDLNSGDIAGINSLY